MTYSEIYAIIWVQGIQAAMEQDIHRTYKHEDKILMTGLIFTKDHTENDKRTFRAGYHRPLHKAELITRLEEHRFDKALCDNIELELKRLKLELQPGVVRADRFILDIPSVKARTNNRLRRFDSENLAARYNEHVNSLFGRSEVSASDIMSEIDELVTKRTVIRDRILEVENALELLDREERRVIERGIINRTRDDSVESISGELYMERKMYYNRRDSALSKLEKVLSV